jgi:HNH endonuclease
MYCAYGPYTRKDGRKHLILRVKGAGKGGLGTNITYSYPKLLLEMKMGRKLIKGETCDHKDDNFTNDSIDNLQVLTRGDNIRKEHLR